ncbi:MAG: Ig-like domain-containing protein [Planctomycetota bacterium]
MSKTRLLGAVVSCLPERNATVSGGWNEMMTRLIAVLTLGVTMVAMSGSIAYAGVPPTVLWQDNFTGQTVGTPISDLGWSAIPGFNTLTSYEIEDALQPPWSVRAWGMGVAQVYTLYQTVPGMDSYNNQIFHFQAHMANGVSTTTLDEVRVETSASVVLYWRIAERDTYALIYAPGQTPSQYESAHINGWGDDFAWHDFDISYNGQTGPQTVTFKLDGATVFSPSIPFDLGYITQVQFVQQGGAKPTQAGGGDSHLIGDMAVGTDECAPPIAAPTGIDASPDTICVGESSTLSVDDPGAGLTTDWTTDLISGSCGETAVPGGTGVNSLIVSPISTTTYYARTRRIADDCVSYTCEEVTVTVPYCEDGDPCTTDSCSNGTCNYANAPNGTACEDGNPCTTDTCNNGTCSNHINVPNGTTCEDGDPCTGPDTCQDGTCDSGPPIDPCDISNGFNSNVIYVVRGGEAESAEIRKLDETKLDLPTPDVYNMDLGSFGTLADDTFPKTIKTPYRDAIGGQDDTNIKSLCFSNSPVAGTYTPAGARLFGVGGVRAAESVDGPENIYYWTYYTASFQIIEFNSAGKRIRVMQVGLAASQFYDLEAPYDICNNTNPDSLISPWCSNDQWGEFTRHNFNAGCRIGNIRYNPVKNTLMVAANVGEFDIGVQTHPVTGEDAYPRGRIYEFALPDWPEQYYDGTEPELYHCANVAEMIGEPRPVSEPALVKLIQIYEMPDPHSVSANNGQIRADNARPAIDVDSDGNVYFTSRFFNATTPPCWQNYCTPNPNPPPDEFCGDRWMGDCTGTDGDVVKCSTKGRIGGKVIYRIPITGPDAGNLVIDATNQAALGHTEYKGGHGIAVRGTELVTVPRLEGCNDSNIGPPFYYPNIFDLTQTESGYNDLLRLAYLGDYSDWFTGCIGGCPLFDGTRANLPRKPFFAQRDPVSNRVFMANLMGACATKQNFEVIQADDTVVRDVGYTLSVLDPDGTSAKTLRVTFDAASPPAGTPQVEPLGACCTGAPCNNCQEVLLSQCDPQNWLGAGTTCAEFGDACPHACGDPSMDGDCDGDVDQDDFARFQLCFSGSSPNTYPTGLNCYCYDKGSDSPDNDIDSLDFDAFQICASGPNVPANPTCDD